MCTACLAAGMSRRLVLGAGAAALATAPLVGTAQAQPARAVETPDAAVTRLLEGNARYVAGKMNERDFSSGRAARAQGQAPFAAVLGCADSRVAPELAFDQGPGELFVVRVAGNFMTPDGLGSLEFGVAVLGAKAIMVLGHTSCGAVNGTVDALKKGNDLPGHIGDLVRAMKPGIEPVLTQPGGDLVQRAAIANVRYNVDRLEKAGPILTEMLDKKELRVVGAVYDLSTGKISLV
jgi:carbonic anhydrase